MIKQNNSREPMFYRLMFFSDEANKIINKAIKYSGDYECADINEVHLFLALIEHTKLGREILKQANKSFNDVMGAYKNMLNDGIFGRCDYHDEELTPEYFSYELIQLVTMCTQQAFMHHSEVQPSDLFDKLLDMDSSLLLLLLGIAKISLADIDNARNVGFSIPDKLEDYLIDIHKSDNVLEETIEGVDKYVDKIIEILNRKKKSNPCIIGEAGVGKTTLVYRLAQRINSGDVPDSLKNTHIVYINGSTLTSETKFRGDFEARMKAILKWASKSDVILFLDEIHTFINAGNTGNNDNATAGNMIKKYLAEGTIKVIGTTTLSEYHSFIEKESAFDRRLQTVILKEPSVEEAISMIKSTVSDYEKFHNVKVSEDVIEMCVKLSDKYIKNNTLPDKAYTLIDQVCTKTKLNNGKEVKTDIVLNVVSELTGIDVNRLSGDEVNRLIKLESIIGKNLIGQEQAVKTVCKAIRRSKTGICEPNKPLASFLFVGPTGVGKTELCKVLSKEVGIGKDNFIKIDMSEFNEKHSVSRLLGTTAGYVGYGEGGKLTEKVKHNPYSVILLDEIEKAHPDIYNTFLQLLDEGKLTDGEGTVVDFTNCIIVMTSNAGYGVDGNKSSLGFNSTNNEVSPREAERKALKALEDTFRPEFLNRIDNVVIFEKLTTEQCGKITKLMLDKISQRLKDKGIKLKFNKSVINRIVHIGYSDKYGARNLRREIQDNIEDLIANALLSGELKENDNKQLSYVNDSFVLKDMAR